MDIVQMLLEWLQANSGLLAAVAAILMAGIEAKRATSSLREGLLALMLRAEKAAEKGELGTITGPQIMNLVVRLAMRQVKPRLPIYVRPFITEARVRIAAQWVYEQAKGYLREGRLIQRQG